MLLLVRASSRTHEMDPELLQGAVAQTSGGNGFEMVAPVYAVSSSHHHYLRECPAVPDGFDEQRAWLWKREFELGNLDTEEARVSFGETLREPLEQFMIDELPIRLQPCASFQPADGAYSEQLESE